jgi:RND superfamily putative drug exporter
MPFEKLADIVLKHAKKIVILWIILLICAVPFALKSGEVLDYDTTSMAGPDADSIRGAELIAEYFYTTDSSMESAVLLVVSFDGLTGMAGAASLKDIVPLALPGYLDENNEQKISQFMVTGLYTSKDDPLKGVMVYAMMYNDRMVEEGLVSGDTQELRDFLGGVISENNITDINAYVSGSPAILHDIEVAAAGDMSKIDVFAVLMILILVGLFFRSFVTSAMPPMTIGAAFGIVLCLMFVVGSLIDIIYMTEMMLLVSMLGAGCDYCIFILARYREERVLGADHELAVKRAITWAGESITTSGLAVVIGFGAMSICSFTMISSMGIMLAIGIIIALLAALTLITSILTIAGEKLFWPTKMDSLKAGGKAERGWHGKVSKLGHGYFTKSVNFSLKHAKLIIATAVLVTMPAAFIMSTTGTSYDMMGAMSTGEAMDGMDEMVQYTNGGMIMPNYVLFELPDPSGVYPLGMIKEIPSPGGVTGLLYWQNPDYLERLSTVSSALSDEDNVGEVWGIYSWSVMAEKAASEIPKGGMSDKEYTIAVYSAAAAGLPETLAKQLSAYIGPIVNGYEAAGNPVKYNDANLIAMVDYNLNYVMAGSVGGAEGAAGTSVITYVKYTVITKEQSMSDRSMETLDFIDGVIKKYANDNKDIIVNVWLTGSATVMYEISELVGAEFLKVEILAVALIFVLLFFVMKSYVTPIRSILTILMSVVWTVAMTHLIFGSLMGEGVIWMIPIILIVVCLGLGMDYDILLTTRIKENAVYRGLSNDDAIRYAVTHSGSVITICGLIMGGAFGTLMLSSTTMLQEFGFALSFAILVDALLVRTYIVPAAMHLLGDWNWKGPKFLYRKGTRAPV